MENGIKYVEKIDSYAISTQDIQGSLIARSPSKNEYSDGSDYITESYKVMRNNSNSTIENQEDDQAIESENQSPFRRWDTEFQDISCVYWF